MRAEDLGDGRYRVREAGAERFLAQHAETRHATLRAGPSTVHDHDIRGVPAQITVLPPVDVTSRSSAERKMRRPHDRKSLTPLGLAALARKKRPPAGSGKRLLCAGSLVWKLTYSCECEHCRGSTTPVRVVLKATIQDVADKDIVAQITGAHPTSAGGPDAAGGYDPIKVRSRNPTTTNSRSHTRALGQMRRLSGALDEVQALRLERAVEARRGAAPAPSAPAVAGRDIAVIEGELAEKEGEAEALRQECRPKHSRATRDAIRRIAQDGHAATVTQMMLKQQFARDAEAGAPSPTLPSVSYIQGVIDDSKRVARSGLGPYDSLHARNPEIATAAGGYRCISYQYDDPEARDVPNQGLTQEQREGVMWASVYSTPALLERARDATVCGVDAKFRTCSDGSPRFAVLAGKSRTTAKPGERPELFAGGFHLHDMFPVAIMACNRGTFLR